LPLAIAVNLTQRETDARARIEFNDDRGAQSVRDLDAPTCGEVAAAAALVVALAIDTEGSEQPAPSAEPSPVPTRAEPQEPPPTFSAPFGAPERDVVRAKRRRDNLFVEAGAGGVAEQAIAPTPLLGLTGFVGLGDADASWNLRAGVTYARSGVITRGDEQAQFTLLAGAADLCVWPIASGKGWSAQPCAAAELGRLQSEGLETTRYWADSRGSVWGAGGPLVRAQAVFDELRLEARAGPWIPIAGPRTFVFDGPAGESVFHEVPWVGWLAGLNLALRVD